MHKVWLAVAFLLHTPLALAADPPKLDGANTAWTIVASALVLFMTMPGLALFYAGLVRAKNVLSVLMSNLRSKTKLHHGVSTTCVEPVPPAFSG